MSTKPRTSRIPQSTTHVAKGQKYTIRPIHSSSSTYTRDLAAAKTLIQSYAASLGIDLSYQSFDAELAGLPGGYAPERGGALFVAVLEPPSRDAGTSVSQSTLEPNRTNHDTAEAVGVVALRALPPSYSTLPEHQPTAELKRLTVLESHRATGLGRALAQAALTEARRLGYAAVVLDSLDSMRAAQALYVSLGFGRCAAYYDAAAEGTSFWAVRL